MNLWTKLKQPPWRTIVPGFCVLLLVPVCYWTWSPGLDVRDGRHDRNHNGIWISHGWLGDDGWFIRNAKTNELSHYRSRKVIRALATKFREHHITDVFPHLCPADIEGPIPAVDADQVESFLDEFAGFRVMPWIGGPNGGAVRYRNEKWRQTFLTSVRKLFEVHPRFAGVHLNVEPLTSGDADFLKLLEELKAALPPGKLLSIAAYPPPTQWQPSEEVHWSEDYFRQVAKRCDQLAVMMYDTSLRVPKLYQRLMADWTTEVLAWSEGKPVLLGVPTYSDVGVEYHNPRVENLRNALLGIHRGLSRQSLPTNYQGLAVYCDWETDEPEWRYFREHFLK
ncbi:MAG: hypothetical protein HOP33_06295 [Verrucomicrobia bacterium]|nr:hypothetical protein [Verrucomicrobiota bacterium]